MQRLAALRVASAYRTVSEPAVLIIAGVIPIAHLARERQAMYRRRAEHSLETAKREEREHTLRRWQEDWSNETRGRWTRRVIDQISPWIGRKHGEINYYLTQFLSGHGYFRSYLYRMGKVSSADCIYCPGMQDDAEHTFFNCRKWLMQRAPLERLIHGFSPDSVVERMVEEDTVWDCMSHYIQIILRSKKVDLEAAENLETG